jgi:hypothetical protein
MMTSVSSCPKNGGRYPKNSQVAHKTDRQATLVTCTKVTFRQLPNCTSCPCLKNTFLNPGLGTELTLVARSILVSIPKKILELPLIQMYNARSMTNMACLF